MLLFLPISTSYEGRNFLNEESVENLLKNEIKQDEQVLQQLESKNEMDGNDDEPALADETGDYSLSVK